MHNFDTSLKFCMMVEQEEDVVKKFWQARGRGGKEGREEEKVKVIATSGCSKLLCPSGIQDAQFNKKTFLFIKNLR